MSTFRGARASYADGGIFDDNLACSACEKRFGPADEYGVKFRRAALSWGMPFDIRHETLAFPTFDANAGLLHSFAMNVLFRASLSDRPEHRRTDCKVIEAEARYALERGISTIHAGRQVAVIVTRGDLGGMVSAPHLKGGEHPLHLIQLPHLTFLVAASDRGLDPNWSGLTLQLGEQVTFWRRRRPESFELGHAKEMFNLLGDRVDRMFRAVRNGRKKV
ncbi:hypothetical protein [Stenotrophomonas sp. PD6]|uniref:hypothetical protein n=1 Tax=Stenotrophomonas sp. PD6 TaxID=3368612 RepID=UPI003BA29402